MSSFTARSRRRAATVMVISVLVGACSTAAPTANPSSNPSSAATASAIVPTASPEPTVEPWAEDLDFLDKRVRAIHQGPFKVHPESEWNAKLTELKQTLPTLSDPDEQLVTLASLVGLLDTHSWLNTPSPPMFYEILFYRFSDGWFVIRAADKTAVGSRLVSIGGVAIDDVMTRFEPLVPHDNHSGFLDGVEGMLSSVEYLHGSGIVADPAKPGYLVERPTGETATIDPPAVQQEDWEETLGVVGDLVGDAPEAVKERTNGSWWRVDKANDVFLWSYNDYVSPRPGIDAMTAALDAKQVDRVVLDLRYLRGGNGGVAFPMVDALVADPRVNRKGGLTVLIGRENVSAGTIVVRMLDVRTLGLLVGEPTPARADNYLCECVDVTLPNSRLVVTLPNAWLHNGDARLEVPPDIEMLLASEDFFAGRDPVLDGALHGLEAPG